MTLTKEWAVGLLDSLTNFRQESLSLSVTYHKSNKETDTEDPLFGGSSGYIETHD